MINDNKLSFDGQDIYVGIDTGKKSWTVTILTEQIEHKTFTQPPDPDLLVRYLHKHFPSGHYKCAYEAGYFGFWIHESLTRQGLDCIVVHPSDIPTRDKERCNRNDTVDSRKIARNLREGSLIPLHIPHRELQEDRCLVRLRMTMTKKQTRCKNQIKGLLSYYGIKIPEEISSSHWSNRFIIWLEGLTEEGDDESTRGNENKENRFRHRSGKQALRMLLSELKYYRTNIAQITREIRHLSEQEYYKESVGYLKTIPGISTLSAMVILTELGDIRRFKDIDHLASYVGLIPQEDSSGGEDNHGGVTRRRNTNLRHLIIESSWVAVRKDPALLMSLIQLSKRMPKNKAIIRIARKLLSRIYYVLKNRKNYVIGVVS